ncbi:MAG TPA: sulfatase-like hydrolase/transferase [Gemmataceae bacterium]|jgi:arylsulfatase A-like enzyme
MMVRLLPWLVCLAASAAPALTAAEPRPPNLVLIVTDNQGAWTLGCYGNPDIKTPTIDGLAKQGMLFERCFASNPVCSPTRATLLTGLIPSQHGVHSYLAAGEPQVGPNAHCVIREFRTLPKILSESGYVCGLAGKWHLGGNLTPQEGFTAWATMPTGHTTTFYNADVIENGQIRKEPTYLTDLWTDRGVQFIEQNKGRPFFLYLAYNGPYGLGADVLRPARNRHAAYYADKDLPSFPRGPAHPWLRSNRDAVNNLTAIRRYAAEVSGVDDGVGRILAALKRLDLENDTLVVFTADQGWGGGQHGIWGMADHTRPRHAFDETMHVPLIVRWPGRVPAGKRSDLLVRNYDLFPTLLDCLGLADKAPQTPPPPGRSFAAALRGESIPWDNVAFYEFETARAVRTGDWKYVRRFPNGPDELYDLAHDPGERVNLVNDPARAAVRADLGKRLEAFFARYADPQYDLWRGGRSKAPRLRD